MKKYSKYFAQKKKILFYHEAQFLSLVSAGNDFSQFLKIPFNLHV